MIPVPTAQPARGVKTEAKAMILAAFTNNNYLITEFNILKLAHILILLMKMKTDPSEDAGVVSP